MNRNEPRNKRENTLIVKLRILAFPSKSELENSSENYVENVRQPFPVTSHNTQKSLTQRGIISYRVSSCRTIPWCLAPEDVEFLLCSYLTRESEKLVVIQKLLQKKMEDESPQYFILTQLW